MKEKRENEKQDITGKERKKETGKREGGKKIRRKRILAQSSERKPGPQPTALPSGGGKAWNGTVRNLRTAQSRRGSGRVFRTERWLSSAPIQKGFLGVICTKGSASFECGDGGVEMGGGSERQRERRVAEGEKGVRGDGGTWGGGDWGGFGGRTHCRDGKWETFP